LKARRVKKLDPAATLAENAARMVLVRLDEMRSFAPKAIDGRKVKAQHDMRIATKRLRYVLEATEFCFGRSGETARRRARDLQDVLGELHDCDVMLPRVREHLADLRSQDSRTIHARAGEAPDLDPRLVSLASHRTAYRGLESLAVYYEARRALLFDRFREQWRRQEEMGTWDRLERAANRQLDRARRRRRAARRAERAREEHAVAERQERRRWSAPDAPRSSSPTRGTRPRDDRRPAARNARVPAANKVWPRVSTPRNEERHLSTSSEYVQDSPLLREAYELAAGAHRQARRRRNADMRHPVAVGGLLHQYGYDDEVVAAGLMHELLEDTDVEAGEITARFGPEVGAWVEAMTEDPSIEAYEERKAEHRARVAAHSPEAAAIYGADKVAKLRQLDRGAGPLAARQLDHYWSTLNELSASHPDLPFLAELDARLRTVDAERESAARR